MGFSKTPYWKGYLLSEFFFFFLSFSPPPQKGGGGGCHIFKISSVWKKKKNIQNMKTESQIQMNQDAKAPR